MSDKPLWFSLKRKKHYLLANEQIECILRIDPTSDMSSTVSPNILRSQLLQEEILILNSGLIY